jgi:hypothetical protein
MKIDFVRRTNRGWAMKIDFVDLADYGGGSPPLCRTKSYSMLTRPRGELVGPRGSVFSSSTLGVYLGKGSTGVGDAN